MQADAAPADPEVDADRVAASLTDRLAGLRLVDLSADDVTALIIDSVVDWAGAQQWRVYRRAASVLRLPPPYDRRHSVVDVACARPAGPPVVVEVDRTDRQRTVDKLLAEAGAGRVAIWVRWGAGRFTAPPPPVRLVGCAVSQRRLRGTTVYSRLAGADRPAPEHSTGTDAPAVPMALPLAAPDGASPTDGARP